MDLAVRLCIALRIASAGGCLGLDSEIDIRDGPVLIPTLRATFDIGDTELGAESGKPAPGDSRGAIELTVSGASGKDAGVDYRIVQTTVALDGRLVREKTWSLDVLLGGGYIDFDLSAAGLDHDYDDIGLFGGLQLDWKATHRLTPYARYSLMAGLFTSVSHQVEIGVSYAISKNVRLLGGYRFWKFQEEDFLVIFGPGTDIDLEIHGLVLGVEFKF